MHAAPGRHRRHAQRRARPHRDAPAATVRPRPTAVDRRALPSDGGATPRRRGAARRALTRPNRASVSFAAKGGDGPGSAAPSEPAVGHGGHAACRRRTGAAGRDAARRPGGLLGMNPFPIIGARIHPPLLRADTLSRAAPQRLARPGGHRPGRPRRRGGRLRQDDAPRGLGVAAAPAHGLVPARSRRSRLAHVHAGTSSPAGRELDPEFAPDTLRLLLRLGPGGPTRPTSRPPRRASTREFGAQLTRRA